MSALLESPPRPKGRAVQLNLQGSAPAGPRAYRFTREEIYDLCEKGWFAHDRINLINGKVVIIPPPSPEHDYVLETLAEILKALIPAEHCVRTDKGFNIGKFDEPLPDLIVVPGSRHTYIHAHPTQAIFAAEVSNTTLAYDKKTKMTLYARAGVPEYWVVDLNGRRVFVHTNPRTEQGLHSYESIVTFVEGQTVAPHFAPAASIVVASLLPPIAPEVS